MLHLCYNNKNKDILNFYLTQLAHVQEFFSSFPLFLFEVYTKLRIFANEFRT